MADLVVPQLGESITEAVVARWLKKVGDTVAEGKIVGEIESTKSVGELYAPVDGEVVAVNETVASNPELINHDAFGAGWLIKIRFTELPTLLSHDEYAALTNEG